MEAPAYVKEFFTGSFPGIDAGVVGCVCDQLWQNDESVDTIQEALMNMNVGGEVSRGEQSIGAWDASEQALRRRREAELFMENIAENEWEEEQRREQEREREYVHPISGKCFEVSHPSMTFTVRFNEDATISSCLQAFNEGSWSGSGLYGTVVWENQQQPYELRPESVGYNPDNLQHYVITNPRTTPSTSLEQIPEERFRPYVYTPAPAPTAPQLPDLAPPRDPTPPPPEPTPPHPAPQTAAEAEAVAVPPPRQEPPRQEPSQRRKSKKSGGWMSWLFSDSGRERASSASQSPEQSPSSASYPTPPQPVEPGKPSAQPEQLPTPPPPQARAETPPSPSPQPEVKVPVQNTELMGMFAASDPQVEENFKNLMTVYGVDKQEDVQDVREHRPSPKNVPEPDFDAVFGKYLLSTDVRAEAPKPAVVSMPVVTVSEPRKEKEPEPSRPVYVNPTPTPVVSTQPTVSHAEAFAQEQEEKRKKKAVATPAGPSFDDVLKNFM